MGKSSARAAKAVARAAKVSAVTTAKVLRKSAEAVRHTIPVITGELRNGIQSFGKKAFADAKRILGNERGEIVLREGADEVVPEIRTRLIYEAKCGNIDAFKMRDIVGVRSFAEYEAKGFMTDEIYNFWRNLAMSRKGTGNNRSILVSGSRTETPLGLMNRYNPVTREALMPEFRREKFYSALLEKGKGDVDLWQGSRVSKEEYAKWSVK